jgi:hypothetical protein
VNRKAIAQKFGAPSSEETIGSNASTGNRAGNVLNLFSSDERFVERDLRRHALPQFRVRLLVIVREGTLLQRHSTLGLFCCQRSVTPAHRLGRRAGAILVQFSNLRNMNIEAAQAWNDRELKLPLLPFP